MLTKESLALKSKEIENEILAIRGSNPNILPIPDGIINIERYIDAKYKILWILKESNDVENGEGGDWGISLNEALNKLDYWKDQPQGGRITFRRMIYASYGILNNFIQYNDIPDINNQSVFEALKQIGYINVKKIPGGTTANENIISQAYNENKELLFKQIETYNPDILIFGNTMQHFFDDFKINKEQDRRYIDPQTKNTTYYTYKNRLLIHAWHPAYFKISEETYCNEIILAVKNWQENFRKNE